MRIDNQNIYLSRQSGSVAAVSAQTATAGQTGVSGQSSKDSALLSTPLFKHHHGNTITLDDLRADAEDAKAEFRANFRKALSEAGIDESQPIVLRSDSQGAVRVANDSPDKAAIEKVLRDNPQLASQFQLADTRASMVTACEDAMAFQAAYAKNPQAAVVQYSYLWSNQKTIFSMVV